MATKLLPPKLVKIRFVEPYDYWSKALSEAKTAEDKLQVATQSFKLKSHSDVEGLMEMAFKYAVLLVSRGVGFGSFCGFRIGAN